MGNFSWEEYTLAKKKNIKLSNSQAVSPANELPKGTLPDYSPFIIVNIKDRNAPTKIWFEKNRDTRSCFSGHIMNGYASKAHIVDNESTLPRSLQEEISKVFAVWVNANPQRAKTISSIYYLVVAFIKYISKNGGVNKLGDIDQNMIQEFYAIDNSSFRYKLREVLSLHPAINSHLLFRTFPKFGVNNKKNINKNVKADNLFEDRSYSDRELMQMLGFIIYHLEYAKKRIAWLDRADAKRLLDEGLLISEDDISTYQQPKCNSPLKRICDLFEEKRNKALRALHDNFLIFASAHKNNIELPHHETLTRYSRYHVVLHKLRNSHPVLHEAFESYIKELYERPVSLQQIQYEKTLLLTHPLNKTAFVLYILFQTGINKEVALTLKRKYGQTHWSERFDISLGVDSQTQMNSKVLRLTGTKSRGTGGSKSIDIRVPVKSHLYEVLMLAERLFSNPDSDIFFPPPLTNSGVKGFCQQYPILGDDGNVFTSIDTTRIRKMFAGAELDRAIKEAGTPDELVRSLR
jgi:hypothetical protein